MEETKLKFITETQFDSFMFLLVNISATHKEKLKIKNYNDKDYVFLKKSKITGSKNPKKNKVYCVQIIQRVRSGYNVLTYHLYETTDTIKLNETKTKPKQFLFLDFND